MGFAELRHLVNEEQFDDHDLALYREPAERMIFPSDPEFIATVYFDEDRYGDDAAIAPVMAEYAARYPGRVIHPRVLSIRDLSHHPYLSSPRAERTLIRRGYVSDLEERQVPTGNAELRYASAHKDVVKAEGYITAAIFAEVNGGEGGHDAAYDRNGEENLLPLHPLAPITGHDIGLNEDQIDEALPAWREAFEEDSGWSDEDRADPEYVNEWAEFRKKKKTPKPFALVEANGLMLGRNEVNADDVIHMAYAGSPESFIKDGRAVINGGQWTNRGSREIGMRLRHELTPDSTDRFFDARHWPTLREAGNTRVTPEMILVWQSQVLASLRKVAWRAAADSSAAIINNQLRAERLAPTLDGARPRRPIGAARVDQRHPHATFREAVQEEMGRHVETLETLGHRGAGMENVQATLTHRDLLLGAFYGMRYDMMPPDVKPDETYDFASWLGHLRRHGQATMQIGFWHTIEEYVDRDSLGDLLFSALSEEAWAVLLDAAQELEVVQPEGRLDSRRTITVTYSWSEGLEPWSVTRQGDTIAITGPLLYFPVNERDYWAEKAEFIRENSGFLAPAPR